MFLWLFVVPQLKGECLAPPSAMIDEVALRRVDAGMGVGSPSVVKLWYVIIESFKSLEKVLQIVQN